MGNYLSTWDRAGKERRFPFYRRRPSFATGNCLLVSAQDKAAKARSDAIDRQLEKDSKNLEKEYKVLLLGASVSGKTTVVNQMKIMHLNGFSAKELMTYRLAIYRNTLDSAQAVVLAMREIGYDCVHPENRVNADQILDYRIDTSPSFVFSSEIAHAIHELWKDPITPKLMDHMSEFNLMDNAAYFFNNVLRISSANYCPTDSDVLRAHLRTTGINETRFTVGQLQIHMFDVGGHCWENKKWIHLFENVTSIIFCTSLSEYDQILLEEKNQNRMDESLTLFESVINSRWFRGTSIVLFLNKVDVFKIKLPKVPLERYFPEYSGGANFDKAAEYILRRFMHINRACSFVYPHFTQVMDTVNIHLVFSAIKETIQRNALKDSDIL